MSSAEPQLTHYRHDASGAISSTNPFSPFDSTASQSQAASATDAFGMAPWQNNSGAGVAMNSLDRRRTPSFSAAVGHDVKQQQAKYAAQRRETFHAGQAPRYFAGQRQGEAGQQTRPTPDLFGHLPFDATDAPQDTNQVSIQDRRKSLPATQPAPRPQIISETSQHTDGAAGAVPFLQRQDLLQQQQHLLDFKQKQLRKQEEQLQIQLDTLKRTEMRQRREAQFQTQGSVQPVSSSLPPAAAMDMFGMSEFTPSDSMGRATAPSATDAFGMDQFSPSSSQSLAGFGTSAPDGRASMEHAAVLSVDCEPASSIHSQTSSQQANIRLAQASNALPRLDTRGAAAPSVQEGLAQLPRSPENLFRKMPADGQTWHLMFKPASDSMVQRGQQKVAPRWTPALVILNDGNIFVHEHNPMNDNRNGGQPQNFFETQSLAEINLRHEMAFTEVERKRVDSSTRVRLHTVKLQTHNHKERRSLRNLMAITHEPIRHTVVKLGTYDLLLLESFITDVNDALRKIPIELQQRTQFNKSEIYVDLVDRCIVLMDSYGVIKARTSSVHVMVQGFLTGLPECNLLMNDTKMMEHRRRMARGCFTMPPQQKTIRMTDVQLHPSVDKETFSKDLELKFRCMEGVRYEMMRFKVGGVLPPPLRVTNLTIEVVSDVVNTYVRLELQPHAGRVRHAIERVEWHFPVPGSWHNILVKRTPRGYRSVKSASGLAGRSVRITPHATLEASVGKAKYEPENSAIVWRIDAFPPEAGTHVSLASHFQIQPGMTKTDFVNQTAMLRYSVISSCVSGAQVWGLKLDPAPKKPVKKWVRYETDFRYKIDLRPPQQTLATPDD